MLNKKIVVLLLFVAFILLIPFVIMQYSEEVNWKLSDFIVAGILLLAIGFTRLIILAKIKSRLHQIIILLLSISLFILLWAELAVGIFGSPISGN